MALPSGPVPSFGRTIGLQSGPALQKLADLIGSVQVGITATPGGTKNNSVQLNAAMCEITVVATANDSVVLPHGYAGLELMIANADAADSLRIFAKNGDLINNAQTQFDLASNKRVIFKCAKVSSLGVAQWYTNLTA